MAVQLVRATVDLGHALGLRVVAEGVEDQATLTLLFDLGCDVAQGYFIAKPKPADELTFERHAEKREAAQPRLHAGVFNSYAPASILATRRR